MKNANTIEFTPYENYDRIEPVGDVSPESYYAVYSEYFSQRQGRARVFILNDIQSLTSVLGSEGYLDLAKLAADNNIGHIYLASVTLDKGRPMHGEMIKSILAAVGVAITLADPAFRGSLTRPTLKFDPLGLALFVSEPGRGRGNG